MHTHASRLLCRLIVALVFVFAATSASAQATRTWVSGVGDDANPCSRTAPCKTFPGAISKTAAGGIISVLDPGGFGSVTITKSITIDGGSFEGSTLAAATTGIIVSAGANDIVTLRNLSIAGLGTGTYGIRFLSGAALHVDNVQISGFRAAAPAGWGIVMAPTTAGIRRLFVQDSTIQDNGAAATGGGIYIAPTGDANWVYATIDNTDITNSGGNGVRVGPSGFVTIADSTLSGHRLAGVRVTALNKWSEVVLRNSMIADSGWSGDEAALQAEGANGYIHISGNVIANNELAVQATAGGHVLTSGNNQVVNNTANGLTTGTDAGF